MEPAPAGLSFAGLPEEVSRWLQEHVDRNVPIDQDAVNAWGPQWSNEHVAEARLASTGRAVERWLVTGQWRNSGPVAQARLHVPMLRLWRARPEIQLACVHAGPVTHSKHIISRIRSGVSMWEGMVAAGVAARLHLHLGAVWLNSNSG